MLFGALIFIANIVPNVQAETANGQDTKYLSVEQLRAKYQDANGRIAVIKGVENRCKDEGAGPAILLAHGSNSSLRIWDTTAHRLKSRYLANQLMSRVTAPTLLLWGGSDPLLTLDTMKSLARQISTAQVSQVILPDVGHYAPPEVPERITQLIAAYIEAAVPG